MNKNVYESAEQLPKPEQQSYLGSQTAESVILDDVAQPQTLIHRPQDDQSFRGDFVDLFMLNTVGQLIDKYKFGRDTGDFDPNYEPMMDIDGYEPHYKQFIESKNAIHTQIIKDQIDRNTARRERTADAGFFTHLGAGIIDPVVLIPIFGVKGVGLVKNFMRTAGQIGAAEVPNQYLRYNLDPTMTKSEGVATVGYSMLFGGALGSAVGALKKTMPEDAYAKSFNGRTMTEHIEKYNEAYNTATVKFNVGETTFNLDPTNAVSGIVFKKMEGKKGFNNPGKNLTRKGKRRAKINVRSNLDLDSNNTIYTKEQIKGLLNQTPNSVKLERDIATFSKVADYDVKKNILNFDERVAKGQWINKLYLDQFRKLKVRLPEGMLKTEEDWFHFNAVRAIGEKVYRPKTKQFKSNIAYQKALTEWTIDYVQKPVNANYKTDVGVLLGTLEKASPLRRGLENIYNNKKLNDDDKSYYARKLYEITGNHGTILEANRLGVHSPSSIAMDLSVKHFARYIQHIAKIEDQFHRLYGFDESMSNMQRRGKGFVIATKNTAKKVGNFFARNKTATPRNLSKVEFFELVGEARLDKSILTRLTAEEKKAVVNSLKEVDQFFKFYNKEASRLGMFATQGTQTQLLRKFEFARDEINKDLGDTLTGQIDDFLKQKREEFFTLGRRADPMAFMTERAGIMNILSAKKKAQVKKKLELERDINFAQRDIPNLPSKESTIEDYMPLVFNHEKVKKNETAFKDMLQRNVEEMIEQAPFPGSKYITTRARLREEGYPDKGFAISRFEGDDVPVNERQEIIRAEVERRYTYVLENQSKFQDIEGINNIDRTYTGAGKIGSKNLLARETDIPPSEFAPFVETDINFVMRSYSQRMGGAIEFTRRYGDTHMKDFLNHLEIKMLRAGMDKTEINKVMNSFQDEKDKLLGTFYSADPTALTARGVVALRNMISLAYMGKVALSALPEAGRPVMVNGFQKTFRMGLNNLFDAQSGFAKSNLKDVRYFAPFHELAVAMTNRYVYEGGITLDATRSGRIFDKYFGQYAERAQEYFYTFNGLQPMTYYYKTFNSMISIHRFLEDSIKWSKGKLTKAEQDRLLSYGIDKEMAKVIARMPIEKVKTGDKNTPGLVANMTEWHKYDGGIVARDVLSKAIKTDVDRAIVTPTAGDAPNMMSGVIRINDEGITQLFENKLFRKFIEIITVGKVDRTQFGVKINSAPLQLLTQFYSWAFGANGKVLISATQGREAGANMWAGISTMIGLGMFADWAKNPQYWENKETTERIIRGVELSGTMALLGDLNFTMETMSGGITGQSVGLRPMLGVEPRFGDADEHDAFTSIIGAGPAAIYDLTRALGTSDLTNEEKHDTIKRLLPLSNTYIIGNMIENIYDSVRGVQ